MKVNTVFKVFFILVLLIAECIPDPITIGLVGVAVSAASYYLRCRYFECCDDEYVPYNVGALKDDMQTNLFGQPLAMEIVHILEGHKQAMRNGGQKALAISLHGWPGTGKNYVASFVAKALFKKGMDSGYVKFYIGRSDFPSSKDVDLYQLKLRMEIKAVVKQCGKALIIFDEVNDIPPGVLDVLKPMMDYYKEYEGVDYRKVVFLFLSNLNGNEITQRFMELNKARDSLVLADFEEVIRKGAYETIGGFENSRMIFSQLIDHYIPFLPLEDVHIEKCIRAEFIRQGYPSYTMHAVDDVKSILSYGPTKDKPLFANAGCKRITNQVAYVIQKRKEHKIK